MVLIEIEFHHFSLPVTTPATLHKPKPQSLYVWLYLLNTLTYAFEHQNMYKYNTLYNTICWFHFCCLYIYS